MPEIDGATIDPEPVGQIGTADDVGNGDRDHPPFPEAVARPGAYRLPQPQFLAVE